MKTYAYNLKDDLFYDSTLSPNNPKYFSISEKCLDNSGHNKTKYYGGILNLIFVEKKFFFLNIIL